MGSGSNPNQNLMNDVQGQRMDFQNLISSGLTGAQGRSDDVWNDVFSGYQNLGKRENQQGAMGGLDYIKGLRGLRTDRPGEVNMYMQAGLNNLAPPKMPQQQQNQVQQPSNFDNWMRILGGAANTAVPMLQQHYSPQNQLMGKAEDMGKYNQEMMGYLGF